MGTGSFLDVNLGDQPKAVPGMSTFWGWTVGDNTAFTAEGQVINCGSCLEWAKNNLGIIDDFSTMEETAMSVKDNGGVYFVPALTGMTGLPFRNDSGRASFMGVSAGATKAHFVRSILESLAFSTSYVFQNIMKLTGLDLKTVNVDGGVSRSDMICQMIADLTGAKVIRQKAKEASAMGAAEMAAIHLNWITMDDVKNIMEVDRVFEPSQDNEKVLAEYEYWKKAAERSKDWL